jgi:hypothetical protein
MSTKSTVVHGQNFHLYREVLDEDFIYLELEGVLFEASYNRVMVPIPVHIWEVIRKYEGVNLSWSDKTDEDIRLYVEQEVEARIKRYEDEQNQKSKNLIAVLGIFPYGMANTPREEQVAKGIAYYMEARTHQQQIKDAIEALEKLNRNR